MCGGALEAGWTSGTRTRTRERGYALLSPAAAPATTWGSRHLIIAGSGTRAERSGAGTRTISGHDQDSSGYPVGVMSTVMAEPTFSGLHRRGAQSPDRRSPR